MLLATRSADLIDEPAKYQGSKSRIGQLTAILSPLNDPEWAEAASLFSDVGQLIDIHRGQILHDVGHPINSVYLIFAGLVSVSLQSGKRAAPIEVLTLGSAEFTGLPFALCGQKSPYRALVQVSGEALRLPVADLRASLAKYDATRAALIHAISLQSFYSAHLTACNAGHSISQRLSRWILIASDQLGTQVLPATHSVIAQAIGVRRAGITKEISYLTEQGLLETKRGSIAIKSRQGLEQRACTCYSSIRSARMRRFECSR